MLTKGSKAGEERTNRMQVEWERREMILNLNLDFTKNVNVIHSFSHSKIFNEHLLCAKHYFREYIREEKREKFLLKWSLHLIG